MTTVEKEALQRALTPKAVLKPMTILAACAAPSATIIDDLVCITRFPFRVGRESRGQVVDGEFHRSERPRPDKGDPNNDLYLVDKGPTLHVSREHFAIERSAAGFRLVDRGSACGTAVGDVRIGGEDAGGSVPLMDGDIIAVGAEDTPYRYTFIALE
jgi:hypothetical protein